jgi:16S rRNA (cytidine1402-2'-O)-methyltransferase
MTGRLYLVPNTLDFGVAAAVPAADLREVLPQQVIEVAARLAYWVAEDARSTRAFLKRVAAIVPLALPLQEIRIDELPRRAKGGPPSRRTRHCCVPRWKMGTTSG